MTIKHQQSSFIDESAVFYTLQNNECIYCAFRIVVGTRINEAHQDPKLPVKLDIRRNIIKKIATLLEQEYLKETLKRFI